MLWLFASKTSSRLGVDAVNIIAYGHCQHQWMTCSALRFPTADPTCRRLPRAGLLYPGMIPTGRAGVARPPRARRERGERQACRLAYAGAWASSPSASLFASIQASSSPGRGMMRPASMMVSALAFSTQIRSLFSGCSLRCDQAAESDFSSA
jgi:hypothetical protein